MHLIADVIGVVTFVLGFAEFTFSRIDDNLQQLFLKCSHKQHNLIFDPGKISSVTFGISSAIFFKVSFVKGL